MGKWGIIAISFFSLSVYAAKSTANSQAPKNVKFKKADDLDFEALLIKGHGQRPEVSVITGNVNQGGDGLLRLRKDFLDKVTLDFGEKLE